METLSDLDLINSIKNKNKINECLQELIDRHSGIYLDIVNSFLKNCNNDSLRHEIINDKEYAIYNSVLKYDENRGTKFSTFLGNEAKWICLNASNKNKKISTNYLQEKIKYYREMLRINIPISAHSLRHGFATYLAEEGANPAAIQILLGHESLDTTTRYVHASDRYAQEVHQKFHPLRNIDS